MLTGGNGSIVLSASHVRGVGAEGFCVLCRKWSELKLSHVEPKWAMKWMSRMEGGIVTTVEHGKYSYYTSDAGKFYLLCGNCEQFLGAAERYLQIIADGRPKQLRRVGLSVSEKAPNTLVGLNMVKIQRALLGIWLKKMFVRTHSGFDVILDEEAMGAIRGHIFSDEPQAFLVTFIKWMDYSQSGINPRCMCFAGQKSRPEVDVFYAMMGGVSFYLWGARMEEFFESFASSVPVDAVLTSRGNAARVMVADILLCENLGRTAEADEVGSEAEWRQNQENHRLARCPCGSGLTYAQCCLGVWGEGCG